MTIFTLEDLAAFLGGEPSERPGPEIRGARPIEYADEADITYVAHPRFLEKLAESRAGAAVMPADLDAGGLPHIRSRNPEADFARLTSLFYPYDSWAAGVSEKADIHPTAVLGKDVSVGPFTVIGESAVLGDRCVIESNVAVGKEVQIGEETRIFPNVTVYPRVKIGRRCVIHAGTVIGSDGFGYARDLDESGVPVNLKKFHRGTVEIEDEVEIGALCAIDRALAGVTRLCKGVKIDNLVQIAHNVEIGDATVIASQVGIAGSSSVGRYGLIGGQVGIKDHVAVGNGVILTSRVGIYRNVPDGSVMAGGVPAMPHRVFLRAQSLFKRLPEILDRVRKLERAVQSNHREIK